MCTCVRDGLFSLLIIIVIAIILRAFSGCCSWPLKMSTARRSSHGARTQRAAGTCGRYAYRLMLEYDVSSRSAAGGTNGGLAIERYNTIW